MEWYKYSNYNNDKAIFKNKINILTIEPYVFGEILHANQVECWTYKTVL